MKTSSSPLLKVKLPDIIGAIFSTACMLHCVVAPVILTPLLWGQLIRPTAESMYGHSIHQWMLGFTVIFGLSSVYLSLKRGRLIPLVCISVGLIGALSAELFMHDEALVRVPATLCILGGHLWAMRALPKTCTV